MSHITNVDGHERADVIEAHGEKHDLLLNENNAPNEVNYILSDEKETIFWFHESSYNARQPRPNHESDSTKFIQKF